MERRSLKKIRVSTGFEPVTGELTTKRNVSLYLIHGSKNKKSQDKKEMMNEKKKTKQTNKQT